MTAYNPALQVAVGASCEKIVDATDIPNTPTILTLAQAYGPEIAARWIQSQILAVNNFVGVKGKLTDAQLEEMSVQIVMEYKQLNLVEFILFCARLRSGKYEDFYGSIDPMRILKSLDEFKRERAQEIYKRREEEERIQREREWEEHRKNAVSFEEWYSKLSEEQKAEVIPGIKILMQNIGKEEK